VTTAGRGHLRLVIVSKLISTMILTNIATAEKLFKEAEGIQAFVDSYFNSDEPSACALRGSDLEVYMARTGKMLADAKYWLHEQMNSAITESLKESLKTKGWSATTINKKIEALCKNENYLVNWIERLNRTCTHQLAFMITMISKHKAEMQMNRG
jgi:hypothetical protein